MANDVRPNGNLVVTVRLTLVPGRDDDLILLVRAAPRGRLAGVVRESMRSGVAAPLGFGIQMQDQPEDEVELDMSDLGCEL